MKCSPTLMPLIYSQMYRTFIRNNIETSFFFPLYHFLFFSTSLDFSFFLSPRLATSGRRAAISILAWSKRWDARQELTTTNKTTTLSSGTPWIAASSMPRHPHAWWFALIPVVTYRRCDRSWRNQRDRRADVVTRRSEIADVRARWVVKSGGNVPAVRDHCGRNAKLKFSREKQ